MHTENTITINAPWERIWTLAADIQRWPDILPHYRFVRVLDQNTDGTRKVVEMAAVRGGFPVKGVQYPVKWQSVQVCDRASGRIFFKHLRGIAQGMWVVWTLAPCPNGHGVQVTIAHDLAYPLPALNGWFARELVGRGFVQSIAGRTLATLKQIAEADTEAENKSEKSESERTASS